MWEKHLDVAQSGDRQADQDAFHSNGCVSLGVIAFPVVTKSACGT